MPKNFKLKTIVISTCLLSLSILVYVVYLLFELPFVVDPKDSLSSKLPETGEEQFENSTYRYSVFVTSGIYDAGFGSIDSADELCQTLAESAGHNGIWTAWLSSSTEDAKDRIRDEEYYLLNGAGPIARDKEDMFDGDILRKINLDEDENIISTGEVWSGTTETGTKSTNTCNDWSQVDTFEGTVGNLNSDTSGWTASQLKDCTRDAHLYCFEVLKDRDGDGYYESVDGFEHPDEADCDDNNPSVHPNATEQCDGIDNNCDGNVDENLTKSCGSDIGICQKGTQTCSNGEWGSCEGEVTAQTEVCDGKDNDCDGDKDENLEKTCGSNIGVCTKGIRVCTNGNWSSCNGVTPTDEKCDGLDNDCDRETDEGCGCERGETQKCGSDLGICSSGTQWCEGDSWGECQGSVGPQVEICDGLDNDCDGVADNGVVRSCGTEIGTCEKGIQSCEGGVWGECIGGKLPEVEKCDNKDNDCDGSKDETCACKDGESQSCGVDEGLCKKGMQYCENGKWGDCKEAIEPTEEICDDYDNDCDGEIDEDYVCEEKEAEQAKENETKSQEEENNQKEVGGFFENFEGTTTLVIGVMVSLGTFGGMYFVYKLTTNRHKTASNIFKKPSKDQSFKSESTNSDSSKKSPLG